MGVTRLGCRKGCQGPPGGRTLRQVFLANSSAVGTPEGDTSNWIVNWVKKLAGTAATLTGALPVGPIHSSGFTQQPTRVYATTSSPGSFRERARSAGERASGKTRVSLAIPRLPSAVYELRSRETLSSSCEEGPSAPPSVSDREHPTGMMTSRRPTQSTLVVTHQHHDATFAPNASRLLIHPHHGDIMSPRRSHCSSSTE